eukprot:TRINITY_DN100163_c0_g1_i1.p1 TRINITY_DN100163_c0_g1~~TRINITY_DN100163_c0_g1_i1.p1  ORF type:complete len:114 (+),score=13.14 TRINITY_DN100163_c0_g1_i1:33-344(+)
MQVMICQRMIEIHDHVIVADFLYKAHQLVAVGIVHHELFTFLHAFGIKLTIHLKDTFRDLSNHFLVGNAIAILRSDLEVELVAGFFIYQVFFQSQVTAAQHQT